MSHRTRRRRHDEPWGALIFGILFLVIGGALLLRNLGVILIDWGVLWPLILVIIGVVIVIAALRRPARGSGVSQVSIPADGAGRLELSLRLGAGRYRLLGGAPSLVEVRADDETIDQAVDRSGDLARVRLSTSVNTWAWGWRTPIEWTIGVASGVPTVLDVQAGAGSFDLDLTDVAIASASMGIGAAELRVVLPRPRGEVPIRVEGGAAAFTFEIPAGVEARVTSTGLVSRSGPSETAGYAATRDRVTVNVTGGAASVRVIPR